VIVAKAMIQINVPGTILTAESITHPSNPNVVVPGSGGDGAIRVAAAKVEFSSEEAIMLSDYSWQFPSVGFPDQCQHAVARAESRLQCVSCVIYVQSYWADE
jgi:hypothetical protein